MDVIQEFVLILFAASCLAFMFFIPYALADMDALLTETKKIKYRLLVIWAGIIYIICFIPCLVVSCMILSLFGFPIK